MRPEKHVKIITPQIDYLKDFFSQLENLVEHVRNVIGQGESWVENMTNNLTFSDINQFLTSETAICYTKCLNIANENQESRELEENEEQDNNETKILSRGVSGSICKDEFYCRDFKLRLEEVEKLVDGQYKSISSLKRKLKDQDKRNEVVVDAKLEQLTHETNGRFEYLMKELNDASDFMTSLHSEKEILSSVLNETKSEILEKLKEQEDKITNHEKSDISTTVSLNEMNTKIQDCCNRINSTNKSLAKKSVEIENLKCIAEVVETLQKEIGTVHSCMETTKLKNDQTIRDISKNNEELQRKVCLLESQANDFTCKLDTFIEQDIPVGFLAKITSDANHTLRSDDILTCFSHVFSDLADNYKPSTGIFTSPVDGIYLCTLMVDSNSEVDDMIQFQVICKDERDEENVVSGNYVTKKDTMSCSVSFVKMFKNDQLYVKPVEDYNEVVFSEYSQFMCFLVKTC